MDPKPLTIGWPSPQPPAPRGVWGPRLADSRDPGPSGPVRGATLPIFLENRPKHRFLALLEVWGVPPRGVWGPRLAESRDPGLLCRSEGPTLPIFGFWRCPTKATPSMKVAKTNIFGSFGGLGVPPRGSGAPAWQIPGTQSLLGLCEGATPPSSQPPHLLGRSEANLPCLLP